MMRASPSLPPRLHASKKSAQHFPWAMPYMQDASHYAELNDYIQYIRKEKAVCHLLEEDRQQRRDSHFYLIWRDARITASDFTGQGKLKRY